MEEVDCLICNSKAEAASVGDCYFCVCPRCGKYKITFSAGSMLDRSDLTGRQRANISGWLRENPDLTLTSEHVPLLTSLKAPTVAERAFKILQNIEKQSPAIGVEVDVFTPEFIGLSWSIDMDELSYLVNKFLTKEMEYIEFIYLEAPSMTPKGYAALDASRQINFDSQIGFCAMWFNPELLPAWTEAILPAIVASGYEAKRIDTHDHNNRIDDEIIAMLRKSKFVVADFTGQRGGVYFEAGFALGLGLPVIWTVRKDALHEVHFDNRQYNFVVWEEDKLSEFKSALQNRIEATLGRGKLSS